MKALNGLTTKTPQGGFMKKTIAFLSLAVILAVMVSLAKAGDAVVLRGEVPFDFYVGGQLVPAGEYNFEMGRIGDATTDSVTVLKTDGELVAISTSRPATRQDGSSSQLTFQVQDGVRILASVECPGFKADLKKVKPVEDPIRLSTASR
jgi:hypothetical protein